MRPDIVAGRAVLAFLLVWMAWIHLHLWDLGYRHLHVVGPLFLAGAVAAAVVAAAVLVAPSRLLAVPAAAGGLLAGGTLIGLAVSVNHGLFGFKDSLNAPFAVLSIGVEAPAVLAGALLTFLAVRPGRRGPATVGTRSDPTPAGK